MKISKNNHLKGFTLIELLVVLAIIATLAGISFPIINSVRNSSKKTETKVRMREFTAAVDNYFDDNKSLPHVGDYPDNDAILDIGNNDNPTQYPNELRQVLSILLNEEQNATNTVYLKMPGVKGKRNGILFGASDKATSILDGWGRKFYIAMDYDMNGSINHPTGGNAIKGKRVILLSRGVDLDDKTDDVYSWE